VSRWGAGLRDALNGRVCEKCFVVFRGVPGARKGTLAGGDAGLS
jgi:hypothetical protein